MKARQTLLKIETLQDYKKENKFNETKKRTERLIDEIEDTRKKVSQQKEIQRKLKINKNK